MLSPSDKARSPLIAQLGLASHIEGGYYRELWRSEVTLPKSLLGERHTDGRAGERLEHLLFAASR